MTDLKPCPFCGGKAMSQRWYYGEDILGHIVSCEKCKIMITEDSEKEAVETWNRRAECSK